jgi:hypothetical protein
VVRDVTVTGATNPGASNVSGHRPVAISLSMAAVWLRRGGLVPRHDLLDA